MRGESHEPNIAVRRLLPARKFVEVRRPHPACWMSAAWSVFRIDVRTFDVKSGNGAAVGQFHLRAAQVAQTGEHGVRGSGDDSWKAAGHTGGKHCIESAADFVDWRFRVVEIDAREAVDLKIDEARSEIKVGDRFRRPDRQDRFRKLQRYGFVRRRIDTGTVHAGTDHVGSGLYTNFPQDIARNLNSRNENKAVEMQLKAPDFAGNGKLSHDTTMERIGWRVTPAAYLGGGGRGGVARTVVWRIRFWYARSFLRGNTTQVA